MTNIDNRIKRIDQQINETNRSTISYARDELGDRLQHEVLKTLEQRAKVGKQRNLGCKRKQKKYKKS